MNETTKVPIVIKSFKYDGEVLEPGDVFEPVGGKWDHKLLDPDNKYIRYGKRPQKEPKQEEIYACEHCDREFDTPQGRSAHMRFCDKNEE